MERLFHKRRKRLRWLDNGLNHGTQFSQQGVQVQPRIMIDITTRGTPCCMLVRGISLAFGMPATTGSTLDVFTDDPPRPIPPDKPVCAVTHGYFSIIANTARV